MILSVSRRTDIPAFYSKWFINRVREGYVYVRNPMNVNQISNIPLRKDIVDCIVFWSKNPEPMMQYLPEISEKYDGAFYFQYTINAYGKEMEPSVPELDKRIETFIKIAENYGQDKVVWRYDPILLTEKYTTEWHIQSFRNIFEKLRGYTDTCVISFIDMYDKTILNTKEYGIHAPTIDQMNLLAKAFSEIVNGSGMTIKTCAEGIDLKKYGIEKNSCIDKNRIEKIIGCEIKANDDKQRADCQCIECADIGMYNTCKHGCRYCYANYDSKKVNEAVKLHRDDSPLLYGITPYGKAKSLKIAKQMSLFETCD